MNFINTVAPIPMEDLKKYFVDRDSFYIIDYKNSSLKGKKLLVYLSNLEIPSDIDFSEISDNELRELFEEYLKLELVCNVASLEKLMIDVIKCRKELISHPFLEFLIKDNELIIDEWVLKLDSLTLFNMYTIDSDECKDFVKEHFNDETDSLVGVNFVSLLKHESFYETYQKINKDSLKFYKNYFENYMFKGKNLYYYWANESNPLFLLTFGISIEAFSNEEYIDSKKKTLKELEDASLI